MFATNNDLSRLFDKRGNLICGNLELLKTVKIDSIHSYINDQANERKIVSLHKPEHSYPNKEKPFLAIHGGLGNPEASVIRLYSESLKALQTKYNLVAIDPYASTNPQERKARINEIKEKLGIEYAKTFSPQEYFETLKNTEKKPAGVFILTPVAYHTSTIKNYEEQLAKNNENMLFVVEKPSCSLGEINNINSNDFHDLQQEGFFDFIDRLSRQNNSFYLVDSAMVSHSLNYLLENNLLDNLGKITKINAIGLDMPASFTEENQDLNQFLFQNKIPEINERSLLSLKTSGGAGLGFDMGIHALAGLSRLLDSQGYDLSEAKIKKDKVKLEAIDENTVKNRDAAAETYVSAQAKLGDIEIYFEGGKGAEIWDRRLEIFTENAIVILGLGTLKHKNYIMIIPKDSKEKAQIINFESADSGYQIHMQDIYNLLEHKDSNNSNQKNNQNSGRKQELSPQKSVKIMKSAMDFISKVFFAHGKSISGRESNIKKVSQMYSNQNLTDEEKSIRALLEKLKGFNGIFRKNLI